VQQRLTLAATAGQIATLTVFLQLRHVAANGANAQSEIAETRLPSIGVLSTTFCEPPSDIIMGFLSLQRMIGRLRKARPLLSRGKYRADTSGF